MVEVVGKVNMMVCNVRILLTRNLGMSVSKEEWRRNVKLTTAESICDDLYNEKMDEKAEEYNVGEIQIRKTGRAISR